jgi:hypothetical protein
MKIQLSCHSGNKNGIAGRRTDTAQQEGEEEKIKKVKITIMRRIGFLR